MITQTRHIDLTVPTGWNQCSTEQLEQISQILLRRTAMQDRYHPYDPLQFKAECFFALAGLTVVGQQDDVAESGEQTFIVRQGRGEPFTMAVWQVHSFVEQHLKWLEDFTGLWLFPYQTFGHYWTLDRHLPFLHRRTLEGPAPLLDGMSWRQYRFANDWLTAYTADENAEARIGFLQALFDVIDLGHKPRRLCRMRPYQFQLCLIWWQSMMKEMQQKYRRCFKTGKTGMPQSQTPVDLYSRSTATLQDKYHLTEDEINRQPCRVILQHLEDMSREAEELEKLNRRHK